MSIRFSSTALFTAARICVLPAEGAATGAVIAGGGTTAGAMLASVAEYGNSFGGGVTGRCAGAGAVADAADDNMSSWLATETASCLTSMPRSLISPTTVCTRSAPAELADINPPSTAAS